MPATQRLWRRPKHEQKAALALAVLRLRRKARERDNKPWEPLPIQIHPPWNDPSWEVWVARGSRGSGKTEGCSRAILEHLRDYGRYARVGIGAPTIADARDTCAEGPSGLITIAPDEFKYNRSLGEARHKKGGYVKFLGSEKPARWNGPQWTILWWDELSLCNRASYDQSQFGLRLGEYPRTLISTTPKSAMWVKDIAEDSATRETFGTFLENPYISERAKMRWIKKYTGTRLEKSEILGQWTRDNPGALWDRDDFAIHVALEELPELYRVVIGVDPPATSKKKEQGDREDSDEAGIIGAGLGIDGMIYVLGDYSLIGAPDEWGQTAVDAYDDLSADKFVAEVNNGGEMVRFVLDTVWTNPNAKRRHIGPVPYKSVWASRNKMIRADPVAALYKQNRVRHVRGVDAHDLDLLEDQMCNWTPQSKDSPDRMDGAVWAITELMFEQELSETREDDTERVEISAY